MSDQAVPEQIKNRSTLEDHLDKLVRLDPNLNAVRVLCGEVPLGLNGGGFAGMLQVVNGQLLSVESARAIQTRVVAAMGEVSAERFLTMAGADFREAGMSYSKINCLKGIAEAERDGVLDYASLPSMAADKAIKHLKQFKGIGPWTAEVYLLFGAGHGDIFPAGDLALQKIVGRYFNLDVLPSDKVTRKMTAAWSPYRGAAARLMWRYFAVEKQREGMSL